MDKYHVLGLREGETWCKLPASLRSLRQERHAGLFLDPEVSAIHRDVIPSATGLISGFLFIDWKYPLMNGLILLCAIAVRGCRFARDFNLILSPCLPVGVQTRCALLNKRLERLILRI